METPQPEINHTPPPPEEHPAQHPDTRTNYLSLVGLFIMLFGALFLIDQNLKTGWLSGIAMPIAGIAMLVEGLRKRQYGWMIPACLVLGLGIGAFIALTPIFPLPDAQRVGALFLAFGGGWLLLCLVSYLMLHKTAWWTFFVGMVILSIGLAFWFSKPETWLTDAVLFVITGTGFGFLVWGLAERLLGLIIPGCILLGIGPGVGIAWGNMLPDEFNGLIKTGVMLVCFGLGWLLLTPLSRVITNTFVWWPLIPGGILFATGFGLYIGGKPDNALSFIGNTGSIGLIMFGLYLFLMRKGIRK
jgi:hypothetical protein